MKVKEIVFLFICMSLPVHFVVAEEELEIFDGHIHYSADAWDQFTPEQALKLMTEAGITRALVSATPGEGAERLYLADPKRVVPFLRPYSRREHRATWSTDVSIVNYVKKQLARIPYRGIGEFHLSGEQADNPIVTEIIQLARERSLALHAHTDSIGIEVILDQAPDIAVIWAHGGYKVPEARLRELLSEYKQLYIELSFRAGITEAGKVTSVWTQLFSDFKTRFLMGMDTYIPERWEELPQLAEEGRKWLRQLPPEIAKEIAYGNAARLFPF